MERRLHATKPLPGKPPSGGDPDEVHIFVIGDWGTYPGTGINMGSAWTTSQWNTYCFQGSSSPEAFKKAKADGLITAEEVVKSWGRSPGRPVCGSMHIECSWTKAGVEKSDKCNPDKDWWWRDHFAQQNVAKTMTDLAIERKPSFVINTADNFYFAGVEGLNDQLWSLMFEELYTDESLQIPWLSSLGNHDYGGHTCDKCLFKASGRDTRRDSPCSQAMIDYDTEHDWQWPKDKEVRWVMPMKGRDRWYMKSFVFNKAKVTLDVFVIDTNMAHISSQCGLPGREKRECPAGAKEQCISFFMELWSRQKNWLLPALEQSKADWKMVVGHAPPENFEESLMEDMRDRGVSVYMAGHVHQLRHDQHPSGIETIISGSGGGYQSAGGGTAYTLHETQDYGFASINVTKDQLTIEYWNDQGRRLWDPIVVPKMNLVEEGLLKKLRDAALKSNVQAMKDAMAKAKDSGVSDRRIWAAALAGIKAFEAEGGLAWVFMQPKLMKNGAARTSGILAAWTTEDSLPTSITTLTKPASCCSGEDKFQKDHSVLCFQDKEKCSGQQMAEHLVGSGAGTMLLVSNDQLMPDQNAPDAKAFSLPVVSIPGDFVKDVDSWMGNQAEVISITYTGGTKGYQDAINQARSAGVPDNIIQEATLASEQRRAIEHLKTALGNDDVRALQEALDLAMKCHAENEIVEEAKRKLVLLELEGSLKTVHKECNDFYQVNHMIEQAQALETGNVTDAITCRMHLALEALEDALKKGAECQEPMEKAIAWCKLANVLEEKIVEANDQCKQQAKAEVSPRTMNSVVLWLVIFVLLLAGIGGISWLMTRRSPQAAPTLRSEGGGTELLERS